MHSRTLYARLFSLMRCDMLTIKEKIFTLDKLIVIFVGDSQFWGQGARGWKASMPDFKVGETRRLPKSVPTCASMLEKHLSEIRGPEKETIVINSAVGNTPTDKYFELYFKKMVLDNKPDIVIMMHAINDWLYDRNVSIECFRKNLVNMIDELHQTDTSVVMISQSPILGNKYSGENYYEDYITTFRQVAQSDSHIKFADANKYMQKFLSDGNFEQNSKWLYEDNWHCTQLGQFIYLKACTDAMEF